jgi:hypothetical protein
MRDGAALQKRLALLHQRGAPVAINEEGQGAADARHGETDGRALEPKLARLFQRFDRLAVITPRSEGRTQHP